MRTHFQKVPELTLVHVLALEGTRPSTNFLMPGPAASPAQQHVEATRRGSLHLPGEAGLLTAFPRMHHLKRDGPQLWAGTALPPFRNGNTDSSDRLRVRQQRPCPLPAWPPCHSTRSSRYILVALSRLLPSNNLQGSSSFHFHPGVQCSQSMSHPGEQVLPWNGPSAQKREVS